MSCRLPPVRVTASGVPWRSTIRWCFEPERARSMGEGRGDPSSESPDVRSVHGAVVQAQQAGAAKHGQQGSVQARPHAGLGPVRSRRQVVTQSSPPSPRGHHAMRHRSAARASHRRVPLGRERAAGRGGDGAVQEQAAAVGRTNCGRSSSRCCPSRRRSRWRDGLGCPTGRPCAASCSSCTPGSSGSTCPRSSASALHQLLLNKLRSLHAGAQKRTQSGRSRTPGQQTPHHHRRAANPARGVSDRRRPQRRHPTPASVGQDPSGRGSRRPATPTARHALRRPRLRPRQVPPTPRQRGIRSVVAERGQAHGTGLGTLLLAWGACTCPGDARSWAAALRSECPIRRHPF
jgi:hypothetical protein